jgi:hypothetical protein
VAASIPPAPAASPIDAARDAFEHAKRQLFPLKPERWLVLGLLAFLDQCGRTFPEGGTSWRSRHHPLFLPGEQSLHGLGDVQAALSRASEWLAAHAALVALGLLGALLVVGLVAAALLWLNSRGVFLYLDAVASGRTDLGRSWRQHASAASSYFGWNLALAFAGLVVFLLAAGLVAVAAFSFVSGRLHDSEGVVTALAIVPVLALLLLALPALALARVALRDFVAPLQVATGLPCGAAVRVLEGLVMAQPGAFVVYLVLKLLFVVGIGLVVVLGGCLTCCLAFLPVVMQTVFQPLFFFERSFSVLLLRRMGYDVPGRLSA